MRPAAKYLLLQIPGWLVATCVLVALWDLGKISSVGSIFVLLLWMGKDIVLYPFLRVAYRSDVRTGVDRLLGQSAVVRRRLDPEGYVLVQGELWRAKVQPGRPPVAVACSVRVVGTKRWTLIVEAESGDAS